MQVHDEFENMSMFEQDQYINEYVLKQLGVDSIDVDSTAFENPQVKESECK
jgi:hypothetical protein|tara:strand:+ start:43 stop:195 length:153 start_codon:yes stop_codon:yes gene_type:complete